MLICPAKAQRLQAICCDTASQPAQEVRKEVDARRMEALRHRVRVLCPDSKPEKIHTPQAALRELEVNGSEPVGFLQTFNMWR